MKNQWVTPGILVSLFLFFAERSRGDSSPHQGGSNIPSGSAKDYIKKYKEIAQRTQTLYAVPALFTLAQGGLESAWGTSNIANNSNNHFGIKADSSWRGPSYNGYRKYNSVADSFMDHGKFLVENNRYHSAFSNTNPYAFMNSVAAAGYAEDPDYTSLLTGVMNSVANVV